MTAPVYLTPAYRTPGDDWAGRNALQFQLQSDASPPVPIDITGWTPSGTIELWRLPGPAPALILPPLPQGSLQALTGDPIVDGANGRFSLSLTRDKTATYKVQAPAATTPLLLVRAMLTDLDGHLVQVAAQPLFTAP